MIRPRFLARFAAWFAGYFWLPCPVCKEPFAGFEATTGFAGVPVGDKIMCVCSKRECAVAGMAAMASYMQGRIYDNPTLIIPSPNPERSEDQ